MDLRFIELRFTQLRNQVNEWVKEKYNKADEVLTPADPYGQIISAVEMVFQNSMLYLKNIVSQFDITNPRNNNLKMIHFAARLAGYNPSRPISATGTIALQLRPGVDIAGEIGGSIMTMLNNTKIINKTNNLSYFIDLGGNDNVGYIITPNKKYYLPIVQGVLETQVFTGTNGIDQIVSISIPSSQKVENFRVSVYVNGVYCAMKDLMYDMLENEYACIVRSGITGGIDIQFGTSSYGIIPPLGSEILVKYVLSNGSLGNIPHRLPDDFHFVDEAYDGNGMVLDVDELFNVYIEDEIGMGGDGESVEFTRSAIPYTSRNFVLSKPEHYIFHLKRLNIYSQIDAFTRVTDIQGTKIEDSVVYLFLVPNISLYMGNGTSYFDLDDNVFYLEDTEKVKVERYLKMQGIVCTGTSMKVIDPIILRYVVNIFLELYDDANEDNVRNEILARLSTYFTNIPRNGRIPKSDVIALMSGISGITSVGVEFQSEENEKYHLRYEEFKNNVLLNNPLFDTGTVRLRGYSNNKIIGIDPKLGDILYERNELVVIRGGWSTRDGITYQKSPTTTGLGSVNIVFDKTKNNRNFRY